MVHNVPMIHHLIEPILLELPNVSLAHAFIPVILNGLIGLLAGLIVVAGWSVIGRLRH